MPEPRRPPERIGGNEHENATIGPAGFDHPPGVGRCRALACLCPDDTWKRCTAAAGGGGTAGDGLAPRRAADLARAADQPANGPLPHRCDLEQRIRHLIGSRGDEAGSRRGGATGDRLGKADPRQPGDRYGHRAYRGDDECIPGARGGRRGFCAGGGDVSLYLPAAADGQAG